MKKVCFLEMLAGVACLTCWTCAIFSKSDSPAEWGNSIEVPRPGPEPFLGLHPIRSPSLVHWASTPRWLNDCCAWSSCIVQVDSLYCVINDKKRQTLYPRNVRYMMKKLYPRTGACIPYGTRMHFRRLRRTRATNLPTNLIHFKWTFHVDVSTVLC